MSKAQFTIAISTYRRPQYLRRLLSDLCAQRGDFEPRVFELLVCDNDENESARGGFEGMCLPAFSRVEYFIVKQKSYALPRNKLLEEARGNAIVFIDDDQALSSDFLVSLTRFWIKWGSKITGAKFYVTARYEAEPPTWLRAGNFFQYPLPEEGSEINVFSTNGCIFKVADIKRFDLTFDPSFGLTGGEDTDFFLRAKAKGAHIISAKTIHVFEMIPAQRETERYIIKRNYQHAVGYGRFLRRGDYGGTYLSNIAITVAKLVACFILVPLSPFAGRLWVFKGLLLFVRQCGKIVGLMKRSFKV